MHQERGAECPPGVHAQLLQLLPVTLHLSHLLRERRGAFGEGSPPPPPGNP